MKLAVVILVSLLACSVSSAWGEGSQEESDDQGGLSGLSESRRPFHIPSRRERVAVRLTTRYIRRVCRLARVSEALEGTFENAVKTAVDAIFNDGPDPTPFTP